MVTAILNASDAGTPGIDYALVSADSHVVEPPWCYTDFIDPAFRDRAPRMVEQDGRDVMQIDGLDRVVAPTRLSSAGLTPDQVQAQKGVFAEVAMGGYDSGARIAAQDVDGVAAEVIYPTVGMVLASLADPDYKQACFWAYNRWLQTFCADHPKRLLGVGQTAVRSVAEAIDDLAQMKEMGFKGVMLPASPATAEDYDDPCFDPLWRAAVQLGMPISFHSLTSSRDTDALLGKHARGPKVNGFQAIVRTCQDIIGMFVFGGVFDRVPELRMISVEADAGWMPHFLYRADHAYKQHRHWLTCPELKELPSHYLLENVYLTFQDDHAAFRFAEAVNPKRLMWANDYPHPDATWPHSLSVVTDQGKHLPAQTLKDIVRENCIELYGLELERGA